MATPDSVTLDNINGAFTINKSMSDDPEPGMSIRGVAWPMRKAMKVAPPLTLTFTHSDTASPPSWTIAFPRMGPMTAHDEVQRLDFQWNERKNPVTGIIKARAKPLPTSDLTEDFLKDGWVGNSVVYEEEINEKECWEAHNVWGFQTVDGQRKFCRKTWIKSKKGDINNARVVHDYTPIA